ncbi:MAG: MerR family transcriptional regulator [Caldicoprobacterales bacterium]
MEYTVNELSKLAGVSTRTIRYYDEIGILKPSRINSSGYRIYGQKEIDLLQQILFYRELGVSLSKIKEIIYDPSFDIDMALTEHRKALVERRKQLDLLISNVDKTLVSRKGGIKMSNKEKFQGFKQKLVEENEKKYGQEIREKYGEDEVSKSNEKILGMTEEEYTRWTSLGAEIIKTLKEAFVTGDPASDLAQKAADLHKQWLAFTWPSYNKEAHAGLAQMYVDYERFTKYYDKEQPGLAKFLRDAILIYTGMDKNNN